MAEQEEGPWTTVSYTDVFTSQMPVINVVRRIDVNSS